MKKNITIILILVSFLCSLLPKTAIANFGANGVHDPSSIIKLNGVYHVWGTGDGIAHITSTDLVNWKIAPAVFPPGTFPSWVNTYVAGFGGNFWAPECIFMNGKYYLYYSVSMGQRPSAIGVTTSTDLVNWTDQGMVVYSDNFSTYGSIDPAVFADANNNYWMVFGSHLTGIWMGQIDPVTGKRINNTLTNIAGSASSEHEAGFITYENGYYYLFYNTGICCALLNSTYTVQMGRSASPTGPYFDKNGVALLSGGGTTSLSTSGRYIGPGHFGLFKENGRNILTLHYYDGTSNGYPRLDVAELKYGNDGWPIATRDVLPNGRYKITNINSGLAMEASGCTGLAGQPLVQNTPDAAALCQQWDLTSVGDGFYRLKNAKTVAAEQVVDVPFCNTANGTLLGTWDWFDNDCQKFKIQLLANGSYVFSPAGNADKVIEVPFASAAAGAQLGLFDFNEFSCQQWSIEGLNYINAPFAKPAEDITTNTFTAKWNAVPNATGYKLDVSAYQNFTATAAANIATWNFTTANIATSATTNTGKTIIAVGTAVATFTSGTYQASGWNSGSGTKYWEAQNITTTGYYNLKISSKQRSNANGPKHFKLQYKIGATGVYIDVPGAYITNADNYTSGAITSVVLPVECENQTSVFLRWISTSNLAVNNAAITAAGLSNIEDVIITGVNTPGNSFITGFNNLDVAGTSAPVTGLSASGSYFYRVRAVKATIASANSNTVGVTTTGAIDNGIHDPSSIVKEGNTYWMYGTGYGNGDGSLVPFTISYSTDLFKWTRSTKPVFPAGQWPAWITAAVPNFAGIFWAPEVFFMNGKYYLYYSASAFGSSTSVIGLATSPTLDPTSPDYAWTDQGMVVSSNSSANVNAIDAAILKDSDGRLWMSYGSFSAGLGVIELDATTGLKKSGATTTVIAGGNGASWEAPYIIKEGAYYYLFANRQFCCQLLNSTYYMVAGRSTSITGPYVDKNGISLRVTSSGTVVGTTMLESAGKFVGPGHFGLLRDNGRNIVSMHYYDATSNGYPRVDIATLKFGADGWPIITRNLIPEGRYTITNKFSNLAWETAGCTGTPGQKLIQNTPDPNALCQQWDLTPVGEGFYRFKNANGGANNQVVDAPFCNTSAGTLLGTYDWLDNDCQKYKIDQLANGSFVISPYLNGGVVIEVSGGSTAPNTQLGFWPFNEFSGQQWSIDSARFRPTALSADNIVPGGFQAKWNAVPNATSYKVDVYTIANTSPVPATTIAGWNFNGGLNTTTSGIQSNTGKTITTGGGTGVPVYNAASGSASNTTLTATANGWGSGNLTKYWEAGNISTKGYYGLKVSSIQRSFSTGPRHFKLQYKIGATGSYADVPGTYLTTADNYTSGVLMNAELPSICDNQASVYLRWLMVTNTSVANNTTANAGGISSGTGQSNIEDIVVTGSNSPTYTYVSGYEDVTVNGTSLNVTGLTPNATYYYRIRSVVSGATSTNSNVITAKTACQNVILNPTITNISCNGAGNGAIALAVAGGTTPYTYSWTGPGTFTSTSSSIGSLAPGDYKVTISQGNGCVSDSTIKMTEPAVLAASAEAGSISCNRGTTTLTIAATGGTEPYNGTGSFTVNAGLYSYTVTDANGCSTTVSGTISEPAILKANGSNSNPQLYFGYSADQTSVVQVTPTGGRPPYLVTVTMNRPLKCNYINDAGDEKWAGDAGTSSNANISCPEYPKTNVSKPVSTANSIAAGGSYSVGATLMENADITITVIDANGCSATYKTHIEAEDVRCFSGNNGVSKVTICHRTGNSKNPCVKICISEPDLQEHLDHGDYLGSCTPDCTPIAQKSITASEARPTIKAYPNPSAGVFSVDLKNFKVSKAEVQIMDLKGVILESISLQNVQGLRKVSFGKNSLSSGMYIIKVITEKEVYTLPIVVAH